MNKQTHRLAKCSVVLSSALLLFLSLSCAKQGTSSSTWNVVGIREGTCEEHDIVTFKNGTVIKNLGFYLKYMDKFGDEKSPILIFHGKPCGMPCGDCGAGDKTYLYSTKTGDTKEFASPGLIFGTTETDVFLAPFYDSRVFYGKCLASDREGVFIFDRFAEERGQPLPPKWTSVKMITLNPDNSFKETIVKNNLPPISIVEDKKKTGACREIPPEEQNQS